MKITEEFNEKIKYLCSEISSIEWSGVLFYEASGEINSEEGITVTPVDIYPLDIGSAASTEYDFNETIFDYYEKYEDRFGMKYGHIHSHHNMNSYFSGVDMSELNDNCVNHAYYVSLVVNNKGELVGKIAIAGKRQANNSLLYSLTGLLGSIINIPTPKIVEEDVMYIIDLDIQKETRNHIHDEFFLQNVSKLKELSLRPTFRYTSEFSQSQESDFDFEDYLERGRNRAKNSVGFKQAEKSWEEKEKHKGKQKSIVIPQPQKIDRFVIKDLFINLLSPDGTEKYTIDEIIRTHYTKSKEDIMKLFETSLDINSVIHELMDLNRNFDEVPSYEEVKKTYDTILNITGLYRHGLYGKVIAVLEEFVKNQSAILENYIKNEQ